jgi:hypothetical protein
MVPRWRRAFHDLVQIRHRDRILRFARYVKSIAGIVGQVFKGSWSYCIIRNGASGQGGRKGNDLSLQLLLCLGWAMRGRVVSKKPRLDVEVVC